MRKSATYERTRFPGHVVRQAVEITTQFGRRAGRLYQPEFTTLSVSEEGVSWDFDSFEEWLAMYDAGAPIAYLRYGGVVALDLRYAYERTEIAAKAESRADVERIHEPFRNEAEAARLPEPVKPSPAPARPPRIFIGHGRSPAWRDLKDHLADVHKYEVQAFETGARAGHAVRDVVDSLSKTSEFALLVMTAEDETAEGGMRARQNVVHEIGLFQGRLGWNRAIVVAENGVESFSNMSGIVEIRYYGDIRETFGDVLGTLRREFGEPPA